MRKTCFEVYQAPDGEFPVPGVPSGGRPAAGGDCGVADIDVEAVQRGDYRTSVRMRDEFCLLTAEQNSRKSGGFAVTKTGALSGYIPYLAQR